MSPDESWGAGKAAVCKRDNINDTYEYTWGLNVGTLVLLMLYSMNISQD